jgi:hypothetical protein
MSHIYHETFKYLHHIYYGNTTRMLSCNLSSDFYVDVARMSGRSAAVVVGHWVHRTLSSNDITWRLMRQEDNNEICEYVETKRASCSV